MSRRLAGFMDGETPAYSSWKEPPCSSVEAEDGENDNQEGGGWGGDADVDGVNAAYLDVGEAGG